MNRWKQEGWHGFFWPLVFNGHIFEALLEKFFLPQIREECWGIIAYDLHWFLEEVLPASSQGQVALIQTGCVRVHWHHGQEHVSSCRNCFTLLKSTLLLLLTPAWLKHLFVCLSVQPHPETLCPAGKVQEGGFKVLGLETLCPALQKGNMTSHQSHEQECAGPQEHALHTDLQDWDTGQGAACTICKKAKPLTHLYRDHSYHHSPTEWWIMSWHRGCTCRYSVMWMVISERKIRSLQTIFKPVKRTTLEHFSGAIYAQSKNPSLDLF